MKQFTPIYCNFTEDDYVKIVAFNGWSHEDCDDWYGIHVDVTDSDDGFLYVVRLDRKSDDPLEESSTLGVYSENEISLAMARIKNYIEKKMSFSMPVYDQYKRQAVTVARAYTLVTECTNITGNAFAFCERTLEQLQEYYASADGNQYLLDKLTSDLKRSIGHVERFFEHTEELKRYASELVDAAKVAVIALETPSDKDDASSGQTAGKRAKAAQKHAQSESNNGTFDDYIEDLPLPY